MFELAGGIGVLGILIVKLVPSALGIADSIVQRIVADDVLAAEDEYSVPGSFPLVAQVLGNGAGGVESVRNGAVRVEDGVAVGRQMQVRPDVFFRVARSVNFLQ